jgi:hypothetical protein
VLHSGEFLVGLHRHQLIFVLGEPGLDGGDLFLDVAARSGRGGDAIFDRLNGGGSSRAARFERLLDGGNVGDTAPRAVCGRVELLQVDQMLKVRQHQRKR